MLFVLLMLGNIQPCEMLMDYSNSDVTLTLISHAGEINGQLIVNASDFSRKYFVSINNSIRFKFPKKPMIFEFKSQKCHLYRRIGKTVYKSKIKQDKPLQKSYPKIHTCIIEGAHPKKIYDRNAIKKEFGLIITALASSLITVALLWKS